MILHSQRDQPERLNNGPPPVVLTIAGSDPLAGAGLQADLKTVAALGGYCCTVVTAVTAQNSRQLSRVWALSAEQLEAQLAAVMADVTPAAVKLGMLASAELVTAVTAFLQAPAQAGIPVVLDPVFRSTTGGSLLAGEGVDALHQLLSLATLVTPNLAEAARLLGCDESKSVEEMEAQARALCRQTGTAVLLKGGHLSATAQAVDVLASTATGEQGEPELVTGFSSPRLEARHTHGSGCSLAAAIACYLAAGFTLQEAVGNAKAYIYNAIFQAADLHLVDRNGPLHHFYRTSEERAQWKPTNPNI